MGKTNTPAYTFLKADRPVKSFEKHLSWISCSGKWAPKQPWLTTGRTRKWWWPPSTWKPVKLVAKKKVKNNFSECHFHSDLRKRVSKLTTPWGLPRRRFGKYSHKNRNKNEKETNPLTSIKDTRKKRKEKTAWKPSGTTNDWGEKGYVAIHFWQNKDYTLISSHWIQREPLAKKVCPTNSAASDAFASKNKAKRTPASWCMNTRMRSYCGKKKDQNDHVR